MRNNDLTVILTTKGRDIFTLRWLFYANFISMPFDIYIADGQPHPVVTKLLKDKKNFPNISYTHAIYDDFSPEEYYKKLVKSIESVDTQYIMFSDNDDFILPTGVLKSLTFLNNNPSFIGASGRIGFFYIKNISNNLYGKNKFYFPQQGGYAPRSIIGNNAIERTKLVSDFYNVTFYSIFRRKDILPIFISNEKNKFTSFLSSELFLHLYASSIGNIYIDSELSSYMRQLDTSMNSTAHENVFVELINGNIYNDNYKIINSILKEQNFNLKESENFKIYAEIFLHKYIKNRIKNIVNSEQMQNNRLRIKIRYILNKIYPSYNILLSKYRRKKDVNNSGSVKNITDIKNVQDFLENVDLYKFINNHNNL